MNMNDRHLMNRRSYRMVVPVMNVCIETFLISNAK